MGIKNVAVGTFGRVKLFTTKHSPEICMVLGTAELVGAIFTACKATLKFKDTLDEYERRSQTLDQVAEAQKNGTATPQEAARDIKQDRMGLRWGLAKNAVKCYWPTVLLGVASAATFFAGFSTLNSRLADASAVAASLLMKNRDLEKKIEEKLGPEALKKVSGMDPEDATVSTHKDPETGEVVADGVSYKNVRDTFGVWFDAEHKDYDKVDTANWYWLHRRQDILNRKLDQEKFLYLNDALRILGYDDDELFEAGQYYGWVKYKTDEEARLHGADNRVDIGLLKAINEEFNKGMRKEAFLSFNVDLYPITDRCGFKKRNTKMEPVVC